MQRCLFTTAFQSALLTRPPAPAWTGTSPTQTGSGANASPHPSLRQHTHCTPLPSFLDHRSSAPPCSAVEQGRRVRSCPEQEMFAREPIPAEQGSAQTTVSAVLLPRLVPQTVLWARPRSASLARDSLTSLRILSRTRSMISFPMMKCAPGPTASSSTPSSSSPARKMLPTTMPVGTTPLGKKSSTWFSTGSASWPTSAQVSRASWSSTALEAALVLGSPPC
uniref:Uncharacterized protein n=1 Tax=Chrysemys picta bellii TaxID=8478 RepID=A0A8C3I6M6_CHRPI